MRAIAIIHFAVICLLVSGVSRAADWPSYYLTTIQGWQIHVDKALVDNKDPRLGFVLQFLEDKLYEAAHVLPRQYLPALKKVPIWLSENTGEDVEYYFYKSRILRGGFNPVKYDGIEIHNIGSFIELIKVVPSVMIHELAHAYHKIKYRDIDKSIMRAYKNAQSDHLYKKPETRRHFKARGVYASQSPYEYFADLSVMYFSENDYYPHNRSELEKFDPTGFAMVEKAWQ